MKKATCCRLQTSLLKFHSIVISEFILLLLSDMGIRIDIRVVRMIRKQAHFAGLIGPILRRKIGLQPSNLEKKKCVGKLLAPSPQHENGEVETLFPKTGSEAQDKFLL